jgi:hypothetical protein
MLLTKNLMSIISGAEQIVYLDDTGSLIGTTLFTEKYCKKQHIK